MTTTKDTTLYCPQREQWVGPLSQQKLAWVDISLRPDSGYETLTDAHIALEKTIARDRQLGNRHHSGNYRVVQRRIVITEEQVSHFITS